MTKNRFVPYALVYCCLVLISSLSFADQRAEKIKDLLADYHRLGLFNGSAMIAEKGTVIHADGYGLANKQWDIPNTPATVFNIGSLSKQFTATLFMALAEAKKLDLTDTINDHLDWYREDTGKRVSIAQLLSHTSGIPDIFSHPDFNANAMRHTYTAEEMIKQFCSEELLFDPGSEYRYSNAGYHILGAIAEQVTGQPLRAAFDTYIFNKANMNASRLQHQPNITAGKASGYRDSLYGLINAPYVDSSVSFAAGGVEASAEDLLIWDQALYGKTLLNENSIKTMLSEKFPAKQTHYHSYGYGWEISEHTLPDSKTKKSFVGHLGGNSGFTSIIARQLKDQKLIVLLHNHGQADLFSLRDAIINILYGERYATPKQSATAVFKSMLLKNGLNVAARKLRKMKQKPEEYSFDPSHLTSLGYALFDERRYSDAQGVFSLSIQESPQAEWAYFGLAEAQYALGDPIQAFKNYRKALELKPDNSFIANTLRTRQAK